MTSLFIVAPNGTKLPWKADKAILLRPLEDGYCLWYCEGGEPPMGATGLIKGDQGETIWWPIQDAPPQEVYLLLAGAQQAKSPDTGKESA